MERRLDLAAIDACPYDAVRLPLPEDADADLLKRVVAVASEFTTLAVMAWSNLPADVDPGVREAGRGALIASAERSHLARKRLEFLGHERPPERAVYSMDNGKGPRIILENMGWPAHDP